MNTSELQSLTVKELQKFADDLGSPDFSGMLKQDLIKEILGIKAKKTPFRKGVGGISATRPAGKPVFFRQHAVRTT